VPIVGYTVTDGHGGTDLGQLAIGLIPVNDIVTAEIDKPIVINVLANDPAVDPHTIQFVGTAKPGGPLVIPGQGTWTVDPSTGLVTFTPLATFHGGPSPVQYTVTYGNGVQSPAALISVLMKPTVKDDIVTVTPDAKVTINVLANDKNVDPTTVQIVGTAKPGDPLLVNGQGTWTVDRFTGQLTFAPLPTFHGGPAPIHYTVRSPSGVVSSPAGVTSQLPPAALPPLEIGSLIMLQNPQPPLFGLPTTLLPMTALPSRPLTPMWEHDWFRPLQLSLMNDPGQCDLYLTGSLKDQVVFERESYHFSIPAGTFRHTNPSENLEYTATRPDGTPLPNWLKFDPKTLAFSGMPPKGAVSEGVVVTVRDGCGDQVHATFFVKVKHGHHNGHDKQTGLTKSKPGFSKQIHAAGKMGKLQNGRELLASLRAEQDTKNTTILASSVRKMGK
jgi:CshA-type fibril repeat protein